MKTINFKQVDSTKRTVLLAVYFVLAVGFIIYACTSDPIIFFLNSFRRGVVPGILAGVIFIVPLALIFHYTSYKATATFDEEQFEIKNRNRGTKIRYAEIAALYLNRKKWGVLEVLDAQQNPLFVFVLENSDADAKKIAAEIAKRENFKKTTQKAEKRKLNYTLKYEVVTYTRS